MPAVAVVPAPEVTPPGRQGREDRSAIVADGRTGDDGSVVTRRGFVIDVTESLLPRPRLAGSDVARARVSRQDIDLARGILMARYGVDADVALRLLRRRPQDTTARSGTWPGDSWQRPPHSRKGHGRTCHAGSARSCTHGRPTDPVGGPGPAVRPRCIRSRWRDRINIRSGSFDRTARPPPRRPATAGRLAATRRPTPEV